jgi:glycosyltransferase involved in cell wall biosynthesis
MVNALKDDCEFYYCLNIKQQWDTFKRPLPPEVTFVPHYEPGKYDVAILHVDQQTIEVRNNKLLIYDQFDSLITDIPKIVINHGTPVYPEYSWFFKHLSEEEMEKKCVEIIKKLIGNNTMVVNSYAAATDKEWGFGHPIVHGMNPEEWYDLPKEPRVFTAMSPAGFDAYYNRRCMGKVADELYGRYGYILQYAKLNVDVGRTIEEYKRYLGKSLIYIDTSVRTPMNRARTEAFLSGCCVVQVEGAHDLERWAKPEENIILIPNDPVKIADTLACLLEDGYQKAITIGQEGKKMAMREFGRERYRQDWLALLNRVLK